MDAELRRYLGEDEDGNFVGDGDDEDIAERDFHAPLTLVDEFNQAIRQDQHDVVDALLENGFASFEKTLDLACRSGRLDMVIKLLATGHKFDVNRGFLSAVTFSHESVLTHLFMAGANINCSDESGETALHKVRDVNICQWLLDMGAVQKADNYESFPIHATSVQRNPAVTKLLLEHGAEQTANVYRKTPLHIACAGNNLETVQALLEHGGLQTPDASGATPLDIARRSGSEQLIRLLEPPM